MTASKAVHYDEKGEGMVEGTPGGWGVSRRGYWTGRDGRRETRADEKVRANTALSHLPLCALSGLLCAKDGYDSRNGRRGQQSHL